tara:strand:- start:49 stop:642 length:594 start_codon:yes stop_codon:yes gene_type:complete
MKEKNEIFVKTFAGRASVQQRVADCVTRSMAIAFDIDYKVMYNKLYDRARHYAKYGKSVTATYLRKNPRQQSPRNGCHYPVFEYWMKKLGFKKYPFAAKFYSDRFDFDDIFVKSLPKGTYIFDIEKRVGKKKHGHLVCVKDNAIYDSWECHKWNYKILNMYTSEELGKDFDKKRTWTAYLWHKKLEKEYLQKINTNG